MQDKTGQEIDDYCEKVLDKCLFIPLEDTDGKVLWEGVQIIRQLQEDIVQLHSKVIGNKETEMELSASEAVYGFCAWLTTQPGIIKMGASENCTPVCDAIGVFCKENTLSEPRDGWEKVLKHPPVALVV